MSTHEPSAAPVTAQQAFAELGRVDFGQESMESVLQRVAELAKQAIPSVAESSVSVVVNDKATTAAYTGALAVQLDETQYGRGYGPAWRQRSGKSSGRSPTPAPRPAGPTTPRSASSTAR